MRTQGVAEAAAKSERSSAPITPPERVPAWRRAIAWIRSNKLIRQVVAAFLTGLVSFGPIAGAPRVNSVKVRADD